MISPERVYQNLHELIYLVAMFFSLLLHSRSVLPYLCNFYNHCIAADNNNKEVISMDFTTRTFVVIVAAVFFSLLSSPALLAATSAQLDYWPTHGWRTTTPEEQ